MTIDLIRKILIEAQTSAQVGALIFNKASTSILVEYFIYNNVFLVENAITLSEHFGRNNYTIKLEKGKQPSFGPIYNLG